MSKHTPVTWSLNIEDGRAEVCVDGDRLTDPYIGDENARLIAAAPELLDACERAEWWLTTIEGSEAIRSVLRTAISKAEGK